MSFFSNLNARNGIPVIKPSTPAVRKETRPVTKKLFNIPSSGAFKTKISSSTNSGHILSKPSRVTNLSTANSRSSGPRRTRTVATRNGGKRQSSTSLPVFGSDSEGDSEDESTTRPVRKKLKLSTALNLDRNRKIRDMEHWNEDDNSNSIVHGFDLTFGEPTRGYKCAFDTTAEPLTLELRYPNSSHMERFQAVKIDNPREYKPLDDIFNTMIQVLTNYLPAEKSKHCLDPSDGISARFAKSIARKRPNDVKAILNEFNDVIYKARRNGTVASVLDNTRQLALPLIEHVLSQVYVRAVSPRVHLLGKYETGTDNVYGELLYPLVSQIFRDTKLDSSAVFLDLGSGVGNVVLQAALEIGCESWGMEMMPNPCELAKAQAMEFPTRCRMWGLSVGKVNLLQGNFVEDPRIGAVLKRADVVLVNNQAFTPDLNDKLITMFLDLKEGTRIVSLKSFVPSGWKLTHRTSEDVRALLEVERKEYFSGSVSWTNMGGEYFIARKDSTRLMNFLKAPTVAGSKER